MKNNVIDDSYDSIRILLKTAVDLLGSIKNYKRKILIMGDMLELGKGKEKLHAELKDSIIKVMLMKFLCTGKLMKKLYR